MSRHFIVLSKDKKMSLLATIVVDTSIDNADSTSCEVQLEQLCRWIYVSDFYYHIFLLWKSKVTF